jgi:hypothetical protein
VNVDNVKQEDWVVGGLGVLLVISLLFFPWYDITVSFGPVSASASSSATGSPYAIWGILALIVSVAVIADLAVERLSPQTEIPSVSGSRAMTRLALVGAIGVLLVIKFVAHIGDFGWGFYLTVVVTVALGFFALQARNAETAGGPSRPAGGAAPPPPPPPAPTAGSTGPPGS